MFGTLRRLVGCLIGEFSWKPPFWLAHSSQVAWRWSRLHRWLSTAAALLLLLCSAGAWWTFQWYEKRPKPVTISVTPVAPGVTPLAKELKPRPLEIVFGASVRKLEDEDGKELSGGVSLEPPLEGKWTWKSESALRFEPKADWPADQKYRVILSQQLFPSHARLEKYELEITTPPFSALMPKHEFYTDPLDPGVKQVVATLEFSHPVAQGELEKRIALTMVGNSPVFKKGEAPFTVSYGQHNRVAYIKTSALELPEREDFMRITLTKGLRPVLGSAVLQNDLEEKVRVPDLYSFFKIDSAEGIIVYTAEGDPEQVLMVKTSTTARSEDIQKQLRVFLLPAKEREVPTDPSARAENNGEQEADAMWESAEEIDKEVLEKATAVAVNLVPSKTEHSKEHTFKIALETEGQLYLAIGKGIRALGGFVLGADYAKVLPIPELPRDITIQGEGGLLALSGERKLSIKSRGVDMIEYHIARVPADQINHLVSQTRGEFQNPEFANYRFNKENIARIYSEKQPINVQSKFKANYSAFDFTGHLKQVNDGGSPMQGLFFVYASAWQPPKKKPVDDDQQGEVDSDEDDDEDRNGGSNINDSRFILVTDLGMVVKENADGSRDIFVASIKTGEPLQGVSIEVLAKNGVPLLRGTTEVDGRVSFASRGKLEREKRPVAYVARYGGDVAFMPYAREDRKLDFSRFDIDGVRSSSETELDAFVFTERGIYRPGDEIYIGAIVKQRNWQGQLQGLPLDVEVIDPKENVVHTQKLALPASGFAQANYQTAFQSPTGAYTVRLSLTREGKKPLLLGSTTLTVKEFLPDRMKIEAQLSKESKRGWITPEGIQAAINLHNLYGTPAANRRVQASLYLSPAQFAFKEYAGYTFFDRLRHATDKTPESQEVELGEKTTDEQGAAKFDLQLERFSEATYAATFSVEGFESGSGRSVSTHKSLLVSPLPYVAGFKKDGNLSYVPVGSTRTVEWIAVDPELRKVGVENVETRLIERSRVSVLTKQEDGTWGYESVVKENVVRTDKVNLPANGFHYSIPTTSPGDFELELLDDHGARIGKMAFTVVGQGAVARAPEKNAELDIKLSRPQYLAGDEIEVSIVAPYTGSGLITIERERVYNHVWFKTDQTSSVQRIRLPENFEGTGYVNVSFIRALDSKEVFMSPLSYAVAPFKANVERRRMAISLSAPEKALPGESLHIAYKTDRPAKIAIFAVDEGILQVSNYKLPDPLSHFFRKQSLLVGTSQIVDLILPEFSLLRQAAAFGGDAEQHLNPFRRVTEKPVVFWSGIVDADTTEQKVSYSVPDYFSGTLAIMAVAVAPDAVGSAETNSLIRGPFVITPSVPTVAAPGDQFDVTVSVANGVEGSGENADVRVAVLPSEQLEIIGNSAQVLRIGEGREVSATFTVRALEKLGSANLDFRATYGTREFTLRSTVSVRPASPYVTSVRGGNFADRGIEVPLGRNLHPEFRKAQATLASLPLGMAHGLDSYLQSYPNGCSEQITSAAFCRLLLADEVDFGLNRTEVNAQLEHTFATLRRRQNDQGGFGYWTVTDGAGIDFVSAYVMHFLIEAKAAGFAPPIGMLQQGVRHLQRTVSTEPQDLSDARVLAYTIYLLTREGLITTNYLLNLRDFLDKSFAKQWRSDLTAVYLAGTYALLQKSEEAQRLIDGYKIGVFDEKESWDFHSPLIADTQYVAVLAAHFPAMLSRITPAEMEAILRPINKEQFNTLSAAYAVLALKVYSRHLAKSGPELSISEVSTQKAETPLKMLGGNVLKRASFSGSAGSLRFTAQNQAQGHLAYYQLVEAGYDRGVPSSTIANGLEVSREFLDENGKPTTSTRVGEPVQVRLRIRTTRPQTLSNVALVDLLPGGFEIVDESLQPGVGVAGCDYVDIREDRVVFFGSVGPTIQEIKYRLKPTTRGTFTIPPVYAEAMYDRSVQARGLAGKIAATDR